MLTVLPKKWLWTIRLSTLLILRTNENVWKRHNSFQNKMQTTYSKSNKCNRKVLQYSPSRIWLQIANSSFLSALASSSGVCLRLLLLPIVWVYSINLILNFNSECWNENKHEYFIVFTSFQFIWCSSSYSLFVRNLKAPNVMLCKRAMTCIHACFTFCVSRGGPSKTKKKYRKLYRPPNDCSRNLWSATKQYFWPDEDDCNHTLFTAKLVAIIVWM